jgi:transposase
MNKSNNNLKSSTMEKIIKQCVGIDCSKDRLDVCFGQLTADLDVVYKATASFSNNGKGFKKLLAWSNKLAKPSTAVNFVVEATGVYHEHLANFLADAHLPLSVVLPNKAHQYAKTLKVRTITDKTASKALCSMGLEKKLDLWQKPDPVYVPLKQLTRERERLQKECTASKNQLHAQQYSAYKDMAVVKRAKKRIALLEKQINEIEEQIKQVVNAHPMLKERIKKACTIPGVGLITAVTVVAETNGFHYVRNCKQLASYAGYDVKEKTSGTSVKGKPRISKEGNSHIRRAMHFPAVSAINATKDHHSLKDFFKRIEAKHPDIPMKAYTAVQRKLLLLIYTLWNKNEEFVPNYESTKAATMENINCNSHVAKEAEVKEQIIVTSAPNIEVVATDDKMKKEKKETERKNLGQPSDAALTELVLDRSLTLSS